MGLLAVTVRGRVVFSTLSYTHLDRKIGILCNSRSTTAAMPELSKEVGSLRLEDRSSLGGAHQQPGRA